MLIRNRNEFSVLLVGNDLLQRLRKYRDAVLKIHLYIVNPVARQEKIKERARGVLVGERRLFIFAKYVL